MKEHQAKTQLATSVEQISRLVQISTAPASREAARLSTQISELKIKRSKIKQELSRHRGLVKHWGWLPIVGAKFRNENHECEKQWQDVNREWNNFKIRAHNTKETLEAVAQARLIVKTIKEIKIDFKPSDQAQASLNSLSLRAQFLIDSNMIQDENAHKLAPKAFALAKEAWRVFNLLVQSEQEPIQNHPVSREEPVTVNRKVKGGQLILDFDGTGQIEEGPRIWLPVSSSRTREIIEKGARLDKEAPRRGSQLWIPVSERTRLDNLLPLAFRQEVSKFSFPPIRHNAVKQNLYSVFDRESWNHIRTTAYDRAGHRCQICGKQGGSMWNKISTPEERKKSGVVDCHEVWDWQVSPENSEIGVQKLKRLMVLCKDCHSCFHESFAQWKAEQVGISREKVADHIRSMRMLINRCDGETLDAQLEKDRGEWRANLAVKNWIIDLEHLAKQDFMTDVTMTLRQDNEAGITADQIAGIRFEDRGTILQERSATSLISAGQNKTADFTQSKFRF